MVVMAVVPYVDDSATWIWLSRTVAEVGALSLVGIYTLSRRSLFYSHQAILK